MRSRTLAGLAGSVPLLALAPSASAHDAADPIGPIAPDGIVQAHLASFLIAAVFVLVGFAFLRRRWNQQEGLDPVSWMLMLGIAWVVVAISVPIVWMGHAVWKLVAAGLLVGTVGSAWWFIASRWEGIGPRVRQHRGALLAAALAGVVFLVVFAFVSQMVQFGDGSAPDHEALATFFIPDGSWGPLAFWSVWAVWVPSVNLLIQATFATVALAVALTGLVSVATGVLVVNVTGSGAGMMGGASMGVIATSFCAGCTPILYGAIAALLGSGAAPFLFALGKPDLALYNVAQVGTVWLLAGSLVLGLPEEDAACSVEDP